ncbi:hypothetical protein [Bifidobacterium sp. SO4]|uniref:hypothetical protein n=1 Tax=Bifidobacterium sp. SO4 TaxID=2809030 RepID=UPI001BDCF320|nr:hypothetical protein [Bifidobacterium sp. SO4]MBT1171262.1 hypothetical protein [Bifidobacterium sp. SO4]
MAATQIIDVAYTAPGLVGERGEPGSPGITAVVVESVPAERDATATLVGTTLYLQIPRGKGDKGDPGPAGVTSVVVRLLAAGSQPTTNLADGVLTLGIPAGEKGDTGRPFTVKGQVADATKLPATGLEAGDAYQTLDDSHVRQWNGTQWLDLGEFSTVAASVTVTAPLSGTGGVADPLKLGVGSGLAVDAQGLLNVVASAATRVIPKGETLPTGLPPREARSWRSVRMGSPSTERTANDGRY